jgi:hypothetical protein
MSTICVFLDADVARVRDDADDFDRAGTIGQLWRRSSSRRPMARSPGTTAPQVLVDDRDPRHRRIAAAKGRPAASNASTLK